MRIALLSYRSKEHCGGQGVYVRYLSGGLAEPRATRSRCSPASPTRKASTRGCRLTEAAQPRPVLRPGPHGCRRCATLRGPLDVLEYLTTATGCFAEPLTFSLRAARAAGATAPASSTSCTTTSRSATACSPLRRRGVPLVATIHHPISRDRRLELDAAPWRRKAVGGALVRLRPHAGAGSRAGCRCCSGVSDAATADTVARLRHPDPDRFRVVPLGVDIDVFRPRRAAGAGPHRRRRQRRPPAQGRRPTCWTRWRSCASTATSSCSSSPRCEPGGPTERRIDELGLRRRRHTCAAASPTRSWPRCSPRPRSCACPRCTRGSRCRPSRRWPAARRWSPAGPARCPRSSGPTATARCSSSRATPGRWATALARCSTRPADRDRLGAAGPARGPWSASAGRPSRAATVAAYQEAIAGARTCRGRTPC